MAKREFPWSSSVSSPYGAPMGRRSTPLRDMSGKVRLARVPFVDGDYDPGGAYWGGGRYSLPLFCVWNDDAEHYLRAANRDAAKRLVREGNAKLTFWR